jgi:hypothetical protein
MKKIKKILFEIINRATDKEIYIYVKYIYLIIFWLILLIKDFVTESSLISFCVILLIISVNISI